MSEPLFNFDTSTEVRQVEAFEKTLDKAIATLSRINKTDLSKLTSEIESLSRSETGSVRALVAQGETLKTSLESLVELRKKIATGDGTKDGVWKELLKNTQTEARKLRALVIESNADILELQKKFYQSQAANAVVEATAAGRAFSALTARGAPGVTKNQQSMFTQMLFPSKAEMVEGAAKAAADYQAAMAAEMAKARQFWQNYNGTIGVNSSALKKSAKESAMVFEEAFATEQSKARQLFANFNQALGINRTGLLKSAKESAAVFEAAYQAELNKARSQVKTATLTAEGTYSSINSGKLMNAAEVEKVSKAWRGLTVDGNDVHSMARGLASGFNLLWLTWGNLVPLFAGAAISNGFMQTAKMGAEVAHTMSIIENLGGNTKEEMAGLTKELVRLGNSGPQGPIAIAEAMKTLSLAGLKANDILAVTQDVLNFSVAGTTDLKTAADVLVSVSTAFGMGAAGFGRVSDVVSKAAAESKSSVESFGNAMKTASVINAQYGVSLEDTATAIAAMSQLGIEGTAAGTALRNMYSDLSGRSKQVAAALKSQGIEMRTSTGEFRPMIDVVGDLNTKLQKLDGIGQKNLLQVLLSERGAKGMVEMLRLINEQADDLGKNFPSKLAQVRAAIEDSYGFSAVAAAKLSQTVQSQFEAVKATLQTTMVEAFKSMEPGLLLIADRLKSTFSSPEFVSGLSSLVLNVAQLAASFVNLGSFLVQHAAAVAVVTAAYMGLRVAINYAAADTAKLAVAEGAASAAKLSGMARLAGAIPGVGTAVALLTGAWVAYDFWRNKSNDTDQAAVDKYNNNIVKTLNDQAAKIERLNQLRAAGLSLSEAQSRLDAQSRGEEAMAPAQKRVADELALQNKAQAEADALASRDKVTPMMKERIEVLNSLAKKHGEAADKAKSDEAVQAAAVEASINRIKTASKVSNDITTKEMEERKKAASVFGTGKFESATGGSKNVKTDSDNSIVELAKTNTKRMSEMKTYADNEAKLLDAARSANAMNEGTYQAYITQSTAKWEQAQLAQLSQYYDDQAALYAKKELALESDIRRAVPGSENAKSLKQDLQNTKQAWEALGETVSSDKGKIISNAMTRDQIAALKLQGTIVTLRKTNDEYWASYAKNLALQTKSDSLVDKYKNLNTSILSYDVARKAADEAAFAEEQKHSDMIEKQRVQIQDLELAYLSYQATAWQTQGSLTEADKAALARIDAQIAAVKELKAINEGKSGEASTAAAERAAKRARQSQLDEFSNNIADAMNTALFEGGKSGTKKLMDYLKSEFLRKPFQVLLQATVQGFVNNLLGGGASSAVGGASNALGLASNASSLYGNSGALTGMFNGSMSVANGAGSIFANATGSGLDGLLATNGAYGTIGGATSGLSAAALDLAASNATLGTTVGLTASEASAAALAAGEAATASTVAAGSLSSALAAVPVYGWVALAAIAAFSIFGGKGGGPKVDGDYHTNEAYNDGGTIYGTSTNKLNGGGAYDSQAAQVFGNINTSYAQIASALGGTVGAVTGDIKISKDPQGDAQTILQVISTLNGKDVYNRAADTGSVENVGRSDEELDAAIKLASAKSVLALVKETSGIDPSVKEFLDNLDATKLSVDDINTALTRATAFASFKKSIDNLPFENLKKLTIIGAESLVTLVGGLDSFASKLSAYRDAFYTTSEKTAQDTYTVQKALAGLGYAMPATRDAFRALMDAQDLTTTSGMTTYAALLNVSAAFAALVPTLEDAVKASSELRDKSLDALANAVKAEQDLLNVQKDVVTETVSTLTSLFDYLKAQVTELYESVTSTAANAAAAGNKFIADALSAAQTTGYLPDQTQLSDAVSAARSGLDSTNFTSQFEADRARLILAGQLSTLQDLTGAQKTSAEKQLEAINAQVDALDATLEYWKIQVGIANGTYVATLSVAAAVADLTAVMAQNAANTAAALAAQQAAAAAAAAVVPTVEPVKAPAPVATPVATAPVETDPFKIWWKEMLEAFPWYAGFSENYMRTIWNGGNSYTGEAGGGSDSAGDGYAVGTNYVPHDMVTKLHAGEAIVPRVYNPAAGGKGYQNGGVGSSEKTEALLAELLQEIKNIKSQNEDLITHSIRTADATNGRPEQPMLVENVGS